MNIQKRWGLGLIIWLVGCTPQVATSLTPTPKPLRELAFYNWGTYIAPELLVAFESQYGVIIRYDEFDNDDQLLAEMRTGGNYDLVVPTDTLIPLMRNERLLHPLNHANIPNLRNLAPEFANPTYDPQNRYSVPYQWGTIGIGYNIAKIGRELTSWHDLFDPAFSGRVGILDDYNVALGAVLMMLGYSPNTANVVQLEEVRDFLLANLDQVVIIGDIGQDLLAEGVLDIVMEFNGDIAQVMRDNPDIRFIIPDEGGYIFTDAIAIPANAKKQRFGRSLHQFFC